MKKILSTVLLGSMLVAPMGTMAVHADETEGCEDTVYVHESEVEMEQEAPKKSHKLRKFAIVGATTAGVVTAAVLAHKYLDNKCVNENEGATWSRVCAANTFVNKKASKTKEFAVDKADLTKKMLSNLSRNLSNYAETASNKIRTFSPKNLFSSSVKNSVPVDQAATNTPASEEKQDTEQVAEEIKIVEEDIKNIQEKNALADALNKCLDIVDLCKYVGAFPEYHQDCESMITGCRDFADLNNDNQGSKISVVDLQDMDGKLQNLG